MIKTLGKTTWDKIKVGEVFALFSKRDWMIRVEIGLKIDDNKVLLITNDYWHSFNKAGDITNYMYDNEENEAFPLKEAMIEAGEKGRLHKLSLSVQRNWIEWEK